ncbi:MAG: hypothetical protein LUQ36_02385 [Methanoregula sp.]|nr:hypothetical protein [Methanoregula sp.]
MDYKSSSDCTGLKKSPPVVQPAAVMMITVASGETAAISPITASSAPIVCEKNDRTGLFEIVL